MNHNKQFWSKVSLALTISIMLMIGLLWTMVSCQKQLMLPQSGSERVSIDYQTDSQDSLEWQLEAAGRKQLAKGPKARLTIEYLNNENELFRPADYTVRLWYFGTADPALAERATIDALGDEKYNNPDVTVVKKFNGRAYTRRTVQAGWYIAEYDQEGIFYKFNAIADSNGLLVFNEHDTDAPLLSGYYPACGKVRFTFGAQTGIGAQAFLTLSLGEELQRFWLYAEDATGKTKSVSWFMPPAMYAADWVKAGTDTHKTGSVTIAPGKRYPNLKL